MQAEIRERVRKVVDRKVVRKVGERTVEAITAITGKAEVESSMAIVISVTYTGTESQHASGRQWSGMESHTLTSTMERAQKGTRVEAANQKGDSRGINQWKLIRADGT